jgi:hypothetical protein
MPDAVDDSRSSTVTSRVAMLDSHCNRTGPFGVVITWLGKGLDGVMLGLVACSEP